MKNIDKQVALEFIYRAVGERGYSYVYPRDNGCTYLHADENGPEPGCIVGHVLAYADVPLSKLGECDLLEGSTAAEALRTVFSEDEITTGALQLLAIAQSVQDNGAYWIAAYNVAMRASAFIPENGGTADAH